MKLTKTFYYQFKTATPPLNAVPNTKPPPTDFILPSGEYDYASLVSLVAEIDTTARIPINIPFKVQTIHIKNITYIRGLAGNQGGAIVDADTGVIVDCVPTTGFYVNFLSSLVGNRPVGMIHADSQYSMNTTQDIKHTFQLPQVINGIYDFNLKKNDGSDFLPYQYFTTAPVFPLPGILYMFFDSFSITMEFNSEYEN